MLGFNSKIKNDHVQNDVLSKGRKYILSNISEPNQSLSADNISHHLIIRESLQFLKDILQLDSLEDQIMLLEKYDNKDNKLSGFLTSRQMHCMLLINVNVQKRNVQGAYRELYDFIESYRNLLDKPIDMVEKIIIRNSIIQIESILQ